MYEFLKALFGTNEDGTPVALTFEQLSERLAANKDVKIANLAEGGYVSKDKYEAKETELTGVKEQLTAANQTIQSYTDKVAKDLGGTIKVVDFVRFALGE